MSRWRRFLGFGGRYGDSIGDFWQVSLSKQDPEVPNLPLESVTTVTGAPALALAVVSAGSVLVGATLAATPAIALAPSSPATISAGATLTSQPAIAIGATASGTASLLIVPVTLASQPAISIGAPVPGGLYVEAPVAVPWRQGRMGLRSGLRTFADLQADPDSERESIVIFQPGIEVSNWSQSEGDCYVAAIEFDDAIVRDVLQVKTLLDTGLTRVESMAQCVATPGTFFFDPDEEFLTPFTWDSSYFDIGDASGVDESTAHYWDQVPRLFVHLIGGADPAQTSVMAFLGYFFAGRGQVHPTLGVEKNPNPGLEQWTTDTNATSLTESVTGTGWVAPTKETSTAYKGSFSARFETRGEASGSSSLSFAATFVSGVKYRFTGVYKIREGSDPLLSAQISIGESGAWVTADGRGKSSSPISFTDPSQGVWRRVVLDFVAPVWTSPSVAFGAVAGAGVAGAILWDEVSVKPIYRFNNYRERLMEQSIPDLETGAGTILPEGQEIGLGAITLMDQTGELSRLYGKTFFGSKPLVVLSSGRFHDPERGIEELDFSDAQAQFTGFVFKVRRTPDDNMEFELQDFRTFLVASVADETYTELKFPDIDIRRIGQSRPVLIGEKWYINPYRIAFEPTNNKYGVYEICDCTYAPNGIDSILRIYSYVDDTAASERQGSKRLLLTAGTHYTVDAANGRFTVIADIQPIVITAENNKANFDTGGSELTATVSPGVYTPATLCSAAQTAFNAVSSGFTISYSNATNKVTVTKSSGTLNLKTKDGSDKEISLWKVLGFQLSANKTGALTYTGEDAIFVSPERNHIMRVDARGMKDDASGTYTGTPNALIEKGCDIALLLSHRWLQQPLSLFNTTALAQARQYAPEALCFYLKSATEVSELFSTLERSNIATIVVNGAGEVYYNISIGYVPASAPVISEKDIVDGTFDSAGSIGEIYSRVVVEYDANSDDDMVQKRDATFAAIQLRYGRGAPFIVPTAVRSTNVAEVLAARYLSLSRNPPRLFSFEVRGKLFLSEVSDKILVTRASVLGLKNGLRNEPLRIVGLRKNPQTGIVGVLAVDDASTLAGVACVSTCQESRQLAQPPTCTDACEAGMCQGGCQSNLQGCGFTTCQQSCQGASCEGCGQTVTQDPCTIACQGCGQTITESGGCGGATCESACQGCGQAGGCQTSCQLATQCDSQCEQATQQTGCGGATCESACQVCGQAGNCQEACEATSQVPCAITCQGGCQGAGCQAAEGPIEV